MTKFAAVAAIPLFAGLLYAQDQPAQTTTQTETTTTVTWYQQRQERYRGDAWRPQVFMHVSTDLDHVWSAFRASDKERTRLERTREELAKMQADLDAGRFDNGLLNDVIDSLAKSANDDRLAPRDKDVLADDRIRLKDYQDHHNHWPH